MKPNKSLQPTRGICHEPCMRMSRASCVRASEPRRYASIPRALFVAVVIFGIQALLNAPSFAGEGVGAVSQQPETKPRELITRCNPKYPRQAALDRVEGSVSLQFDINEDGLAVNIQVVESNPPGVFDANAIKALKCWRFEATDEVTKSRLKLNFSL